MTSGAATSSGGTTSSGCPTSAGGPTSSSGVRRRSVVVTGAGRGIGEATARLFADAGYLVGAYDLKPCAWAEGDDLHRLDGLGDIDRLVAAARFGARAASVACTRRGADPPHRHDL